MKACLDTAAPVKAGPPGLVDDGPMGVLVGPPVGPTGKVPFPVGRGPLPVPGLPVPAGGTGMTNAVDRVMIDESVDEQLVVKVDVTVVLLGGC